jgi:hypothetical protein
MAKYFIDHPMDKVTLLLDKETGEEAGKILAYYSNNPAGSVCHANVILYPHGWKIVGKEAPEVRGEEGRAGGYGYDKYSAAVAESLSKQGLGGDHTILAPWVFINSEGERQNKPEAEKIIKDKKIIPVYSGAGNVREAFELYFRVIEVL